VPKGTGETPVLLGKQEPDTGVEANIQH